MKEIDLDGNLKYQSLSFSIFLINSWILFR
jgi:hypothetical protein